MPLTSACSRHANHPPVPRLDARATALADRLGKQLRHELVLDHAFVNDAFATDGGAKQLDKLLGGQLDGVMDQLAESLWPRAA